MEHTVRKRKANRIALRTVAIIFMVIALMRFVDLMVSGESKSIIVTILCACCFMYGITLFRQTLKTQAYDITYVFGEKTLTLKMHKKEKTVSYGEITDLGYVIPNESLDYSLVQIYIGKEQYVIPFMGNSDVGKALHGMLKIKQEEAMKTADKEG